MTTQQIADRLHELCSQGLYEQAQRELYAADAESIEPAGAQGMPSVKGLDAIIAKGDAWQQTIEEIHGSSMSMPIVAGGFIATNVYVDVTMRGVGRMELDEIVVYEVRDGKIVKEQFFYHPEGGA